MFFLMPVLQHSKSVHTERRELSQGFSFGPGRPFWAYSLLVLANLSLFVCATPRKLFIELFTRIQDDIYLSSIFSLVAANAVRWIIVITLPNSLIKRNFFLCTFLCILLEVPAGLVFSINGFIGIALRYLSLTQLMKIISFLLAQEETNQESNISNPSNPSKSNPSNNSNNPNNTIIIEQVSTARFILLPTFCYQKEYPFVKSTDWGNLFLFSLMLAPFSVFSYFSLSVNGARVCSEFIREKSVEKYLEVIMWMNIGWFSFFLLFFIGLLGVLSELTRFADRIFFGAWWDASVNEYWRRWNTPMHIWIKRHIYSSLLKHGVSHKNSASIIFICSGFLHEYALGNSLGVYGIGFITMITQIPLEYLSNLSEKTLELSPKIFTFCMFNLIGAPFLGIAISWAAQSAK